MSMAFADLLSRAETLVPVLRERAQAAEQARRLPDSSVVDLRAARLFDLQKPARFGGYEMPMPEFVETVAAAPSRHRLTLAASIGCFTFCCRAASPCEVLDNWQVAGLAATGSRDVRLNDVFIPQHRAVLMQELKEGGGPGCSANAAY